jgi:hypothetical protein
VSLEQQLRSVRVEWPETPALRPELVARRRSRRALVLALAVLVLAVAIAFAVPPARSALLRFFHLRGVTVERVNTLPQAFRRSLQAGLGAERTLAEAARVAGFAPALPPAVDIRRAYARPGVIAMPLGGGRLLSELSAADLGLSKKFASQATRIEPVQVNGDDGIWLEGGEHVLVYLNADGTPVVQTLRLAGNTLVWQHRGLTYRLEGPLTKAQALKLAESIQTDKARPAMSGV